MKSINKAAFVNVFLTIVYFTQPFGIVWAQGSGSPSAVLEEIIVTARKREESLMDTPIAITAFQDEELRAANISSIDQIANAAPGLIFDDTTSISGSPNSASVFIRGIGQADFTLTSESGVGIYIDDAYLPHSMGNVVDAIGIERVEVLRGPQGTLFGRNTIGGAVRVVSKKPHDELEGDVEVTLGQYDRIELKGRVNVPLTDNFFTSFSAFSQDWDGFVDRPNQSSGASGDRDRSTFVAQARWLPTDDITTDLMLTYQRDRSNPSPNILVFQENDGSLRPTFVLADSGQLPQVHPCCLDTSDEQYKNDLDAASAQFTLDWDLTDNLNLRSITYYRDLETNFARDSDHSPLEYTAIVSFIDLKSWSQEIQLSGTALSNRLSWIFGGYYFEEDGFRDNFVPLGFATLFAGGLTETTSAAAFGQGTYDMTERLHLTFGARYSDEEKIFTVTPEYQFINTFFGNPVNIRLVPLGDYVSASDGVDLYGNIAFDVNDDLMVYASYSEGFKGGGFTERIPPGVTEFPKHGPEFATVYEVGVKYTGMQGRLTATAAVFHTDYSAIQINVTEGPASVTRNAGEANINGFEFDLIVRPIDNFRIAGSISYIDSEYTELSPEAMLAGVTLDHKLPHTPKWQTSLTIDYGIPVWNGMLTPRVDMSYSDDMENDGLNSIYTHRDAYTLWNATLTYATDDGNWEVAAFMKNVSDDQYYTSGFGTADYADVSLNRPREWGFRIRRAF